MNQIDRAVLESIIAKLQAPKSEVDDVNNLSPEEMKYVMNNLINDPSALSALYQMKWPAETLVPVYEFPSYMTASQTGSGNESSIDSFKRDLADGVLGFLLEIVDDGLKRYWETAEKNKIELRFSTLHELHMELSSKLSDFAQGSIILFQHSELGSKAIRFCSKGRFSHVGMLIDGKFIEKWNDKDVCQDFCIWQSEEKYKTKASTNHTTPDGIESRSGPDLHCLARYLWHDNEIDTGRLVVRKFNRDNAEEFGKKLKEVMRTFEAGNTIFPEMKDMAKGYLLAQFPNWKDLLESIGLIEKGHPDQQPTMFCSQLVSHTLARCILDQIPDSFEPKAYSPSYYGNEGAEIPRVINFNKYLGPEHEVKLVFTGQKS